MTYPVTTCSIDGRLTWTLDTNTGELTGLWPNGAKLVMIAVDTYRLFRLLAENEEMLARESDKQLHRIGEIKRPIL